MAGSDSQKQLLTLIREFASEKSQKERSLSGLRKTFSDLKTELEATSVALDNLKRVKETMEQEVKGLEVELAMADASIQTAEKGIAKIDSDISVVGSGIDELKKVEENLRDDFIKEMMEKNAKIRKFQEMGSSILLLKDESNIQLTKDLNAELNEAIKEENEFISVTVQNKLAELDSQITAEKEQYQAEQSIHNQIQKELIDVQERLKLMKDVQETSKELERLAKQTAEAEEACASLGEQLQQVSQCPNCHADNLEAIQELL